VERDKGGGQDEVLEMFYEALKDSSSMTSLVADESNVGLARVHS
jgi:hypothetical protein